MYLFAHVLSGILIAIVCYCLIHDRRLFPICIAGALLPDLLDKPLAFLFPDLFGASRTLGHAFLFFFAIFLAALVLWWFRQSLLGIAFAASVFFHQILDAIWHIPAIWLFPLLGPFPAIIVPDYVRHSIWLELSSPSELVFASASCLILAAWYPEIAARYFPFLTGQYARGIRALMIVLLGITGVLFLVYGLQQAPGSFLAPEYAPITSMMAGILALIGGLYIATRSGPRHPAGDP